MITVGFGFRKDATLESLVGAYERARSGLLPEVIATAGDKASAPALVKLAEHLELPIVAVSENDIQTQPTMTRSPHSLQNRGTGSVAEAAALAAAGKDARLLTPRTISDDRMATCAFAEGGTT